MKQLSRLLLATLLFALANSVTHASTTSEWVTPSHLDLAESRIQSLFDIKTERLKDGNVLFRVVITAKSGRRFSFNDASRPSGTSLFIVEITAQSERATRVRNLPSDISEKSVTCIFIVPEASLKDPNLCFCFSQIPTPGIPSTDICYAKLNDFYKP